ncbi:glycosyltransferase family 2 protein [Amphritea sp.]|uniref:glycosyltransferase family 2 protein n=1 Tax=Amphritea sp. TaxID=1872502 RepID=UPI003D0DB1C8
MLISVLINNYNYGHFLIEAVNSVLSQTYTKWELIIVDDGSTDDSHSIIKAIAEKDPRIRAVIQENGGQAAAFNAGVKNATGEVMTFLDADDLYKPDYLQKIYEVYSAIPECDFLYTGLEKFGLEEEVVYPFNMTELTDLGFSNLLVLAREISIGEPTSVMSIRAKAAHQIFPLPFVSDWKISADNALCLASSLALHRKFCLPEPLMRYRIHGGNHYAGVHQSSDRVYKDRMIRERLKAEYYDRFKYGNKPPIGRTWADQFVDEAATGNKPYAMLRRYAGVFNDPKVRLQQPNLNLFKRWKYKKQIKTIMGKI